MEEYGSTGTKGISVAKSTHTFNTKDDKAMCSVHDSNPHNTLLHDTHNIHIQHHFFGELREEASLSEAGGRAEGYQHDSTGVSAADCAAYLSERVAGILDEAFEDGGDSGTLFDALNGIVNDPKSIVTLLGQSLPKQATFFISFVALQFFVGYGMTLSRLIPLIIYRFKRRFFCKTEEELREAWCPPPFKYATCIPTDLLTLTITICYSIITPMILPFAIMYFGLGWLLMRHQALNVAIPRYESGGKMWPHIHSRVLAALLLSQLTMIGYFGVKKFVYGPLLLPLILVTLIFTYISRKSFYVSFTALPLNIACSQVMATLSPRSIVEAYTPPCSVPNNTTITSTIEQGQPSSSNESDKV